MLESVSVRIKQFIRKQGEIASFLIYPLLFIVIYEVFMRYVLNSPTTWGFEATTFLYGIHYMFGLSYTDVEDGHVKVNIFTSYMPEKWQTALSIITNLVFFMPVIFCITIWTFKFAYTSTMELELNSTSWAPPIWPLKILMAYCFLSLFLQGIANLIKDINTFLKK